LTMRSDSGAGDCEAVSMQMVDSLNIMTDILTTTVDVIVVSQVFDYTVVYRLHCYLFSVVLASAD